MSQTANDAAVEIALELRRLNMGFKIQDAAETIDRHMEKERTSARHLKNEMRGALDRGWIPKQWQERWQEMVRDY